MQRFDAPRKFERVQPVFSPWDARGQLVVHYDPPALLGKERVRREVSIEYVDLLDSDDSPSILSFRSPLDAGMPQWIVREVLARRVYRSWLRPTETLRRFANARVTD
jgi:hypothetical protein